MEQNNLKKINLDLKIKKSYLDNLKQGLYSDTFNIWLQARSVYKEENIDVLVEIPLYEERIRKHEGVYAGFVLENSDKEKVIEFNRLVSLFNSELENIKKEKNFKRANEIANLAFNLIKKEE